MKLLNCCIISLILLNSCYKSKIFEFENSEINIQIFPRQEMILLAINTDGDGARKLQLRDKKGSIIEEYVMHNEPFEVTKWTKDSIDICFFVNNISLFEPWFLENTNKPKKINNYTLNYLYLKTSGNLNTSTLSVDSFSVDNLNRVLFYKNNLILDTVFVKDLIVYQDHFSTVKLSSEFTNSNIYIPSKKYLIDKYLLQILYNE